MNTKNYDIKSLFMNDEIKENLEKAKKEVQEENTFSLEEAKEFLKQSLFKDGHHSIKH